MTFEYREIRRLKIISVFNGLVLHLNPVVTYIIKVPYIGAQLNLRLLGSLDHKRERDLIGRWLIVSNKSRS